MTAGPLRAAARDDKAALMASRTSALLLGLTCLLVVGCRTFGPSAEREPTCERLPLPGFPVGANVLDLPDDKDADPENDGARGLGSAASLRTLDRLRALGLNAIALPVGLHAADQRATKVRPGALLQGAGRARLARMIDAAHERGFVVTLIPHLVLDDGSWRGELAPDDLAAFFSSYTAQLEALADIGERHCAEVLSAGVELKSLSRDAAADEGFRALVAALRARFSGELTYSANWDEVAGVRHWSRFDRVSVNAFYPLAYQAGADDATLRENALAAQKTLGELEGRIGRPVWFMEVGFKAVPETHLRPWEWPDEVNASALPYDEEAQARAYRAVIWALHRHDAVDGVYFWMVPADLADESHEWRFEPAQGFSFLGKAAEEAVRELAERPPRRDGRGRYDGEDG